MTVPRAKPFHGHLTDINALSCNAWVNHPNIPTVKIKINVEIALHSKNEYFLCEIFWHFTSLTG